MSDNSHIEWTDATWNVVLGCDRVSPGCDGCYAIRTANRMAANPNPAVSEPYSGLVERHDGRLDWTGQINTVESRIDLPRRWVKPRRIFVNAQSDLFHDDVPNAFLVDVFATMAATPQHTYQVLTKRHSRMRALLSRSDFRASVWDQWRAITRGNSDTWTWPLPNLWLGVSVEDQKRADLRIPYLLDTPAAVRWLSCEPLLGPVDLSRISLHDRGPVGHWEGRDQTNALTGSRRGGGATVRIDWVVAGGESGPDARPMHPDWARRLRDQCVRATVPYFFKQHGEWLGTNRDDPRYTGPVKGGHVKYDGTGWAAFTLPIPDAPAWVLRVGKNAAGRELDGRTWDQYPQVPA